MHTRTHTHARTHTHTRTHTCTANRLEFRVRTVEGQHGTLRLLVVAKTTPKMSQVVTLPVKPLSLHYR